MEKLPMCRICLSEDVRMFIVVNRNLHELYEKLTDIPFVTEDIRPILTCFFCCAKLKQCYRFLRQCLQAEELFAQRMNEDYKPHSLLYQDHLEFSSGFIKSPIEHISIVDECQTESIAIKKELPAVSEILDDIIEPMEEHQSEELQLENLNNCCLDVADIPPHDSESDLEYYVPLIKFKTEVEEEQDISKKKRRARDTNRATVEKKPKPDTQRTKLEDAITGERRKKEKANSKVIRPTQKRTSKAATYFKEPYKCNQSNINEKIHYTHKVIDENPYKCDICQSSFSDKYNLTRHIRIHTGEKPYKCDVCQRTFTQKAKLTKHIIIHTGEKPYKCDICQRSFSKKHNLTTHIRIHTGEKPYKCVVCHRTFTQKNNLTNHIRIHTGEKPYKCDVCQLTFNQKSPLTTHIRIHTGEKPYKCDLCQRTFTQKAKLTKHTQKSTKCTIKYIQYVN